jgi:hypothetical protein
MVLTNGRPGGPMNLAAFDNLTLDELAAAANSEHHQAVEAATAAVDHAIRSGELLAAAHQRVTAAGESWSQWLTENFEGVHRTAATYIRIAAHRDHVPDGAGLVEARRALRGLPRVYIGPALPSGAPEETKDEARRLRSEGMSLKATAERLGVSKSSILNWTDPDHYAKVRARARRYNARQRLARGELRRRERDAVVRAAGGALADAYGLVRRAAQAVDRARAEADDREAKNALAAALGELHSTEDKIVRALGVAAGGPKVRTGRVKGVRRGA